MDEQGNVYVASVKWVFQVMEDGGRRFWFMMKAQQHTTRMWMGEIRPIEKFAFAVEDGWGWEVSTGLRQTWLRLCRGL